jgi:hypothetical protein
MGIATPVVNVAKGVLGSAPTKKFLLIARRVATSHIQRSARKTTVRTPATRTPGRIRIRGVVDIARNAFMMLHDPFIVV